MKNNKGQSLVLFVLIVPVILLVFLAIVDILRMSLRKNEVDNINKLVMSYAIYKSDDINVKDYMTDLINKNDKNIKVIDVLDQNGKIYVYTETDVDLLILNKSFKIKSSYVGYIDDGKEIIERN